MQNSMKWMLLVLFGLLLPAESVLAHGERAQMPQLRMRTVHWMDVTLSKSEMDINDTVKVTGSFIPSEYWPDHVASIEGLSYLNVGVPGPSFVRLDSRVNGVPMIRSTGFEKGKLYHFEVLLKARKVGRVHVHPVINVKDTGPIIGPGLWLNVNEGTVPFENTAETLLGETIDLETYGLSNAVMWSVIWMVIGLAWFIYWLLKCPIVLPRFRRVNELNAEHGKGGADLMITSADRKAAVVFLSVALLMIIGGYKYAEERWPITTPLQTGRIKTPGLVANDGTVNVEMLSARYRIPGRSFRVEIEVTNNGNTPVQVGEFATGGLRFINADVIKVQPRDEDELVAPEALRVEGGAVAPGETKTLVVYADDALWETQRMTTMIASPDAIVAGMLFFFDADGKRYPQEIGGTMIPEFV